MSEFKEEYEAEVMNTTSTAQEPTEEEDEEKDSIEDALQDLIDKGVVPAEEVEKARSALADFLKTDPDSCWGRSGPECEDPCVWAAKKLQSPICRPGLMSGRVTSFIQDFLGGGDGAAEENPDTEEKPWMSAFSKAQDYFGGKNDDEGAAQA